MEWTFEASGPVEADIAVPAGRVESRLAARARSSCT